MVWIRGFILVWISKGVIFGRYWRTGGIVVKVVGVIEWGDIEGYVLVYGFKG